MHRQAQQSLPTVPQALKLLNVDKCLPWTVRRTDARFRSEAAHDYSFDAYISVTSMLCKRLFILCGTHTVQSSYTVALLPGGLPPSHDCSYNLAHCCRSHRFQFAYMTADQVILSNGDRITGSLVKKDEKSLTFKSDVFGKIDCTLGQGSRA